MKHILIILGVLILAAVIARIYTAQQSTQTPDGPSAPGAMQTLCERNGGTRSTIEKRCETRETTQ